VPFRSTTEELAKQIEDLIRAHVDEVQQAASNAVARSFEPRSRTKPTKRKRSRATGHRREPEEVAALADKLLAEITATPGETMAVLAERVGATVRELNRPMNNLRRAGRLRSVGVRNQTRYFPTAKSGRA